MCSGNSEDRNRHTPRVALGTGNMCWIQCKCNQKLERNASSRRAAAISITSSIIGSVVEGNNPYSLHRNGVGVCLNKLESVAYASLRNFMRGRGWSLERGPCTPMTSLSSHGHAPFQTQRFGIEINFAA